MWFGPSLSFFYLTNAFAFIVASLPGDFLLSSDRQTLVMVGQSNHSQFVIILLVLAGLLRFLSLLCLLVSLVSLHLSHLIRDVSKVLEHWSSDQKALPSLAVFNRQETDGLSPCLSELKQPYKGSIKLTRSTPSSLLVKT